jgi:hypothetical protein
MPTSSTPRRPASASTSKPARGQHLLTITADRDGFATTLRLTGDFTPMGRRYLEEMIDWLLFAGSRQLVIDIDGLNSGEQLVRGWLRRSRSLTGYRASTRIVGRPHRAALSTRP